ncbi:Do family serine endopeptidase [Brevirhabdus sp.]|uniref:Do family serine endopeptidase n=1 Tax=Brevirhabdus sp. TaxID=2004514 RepID=UPI00405A1F3E
MKPAARPIRTLNALVLGAALAMAQTGIAVAQEQTAPVEATPLSFTALVESVSDAVVNITTSTTVAASPGPAPMVPEGSPLEDFFRDFMDRQQGNGGRPRRSQALGSGFVVSGDGFIVTNNHVIDKADEIMIEFFDGKELEAKVVGVDTKTDIALLKVKSDKELPFVQFGESAKMRVGEWVMAMGNPLGQGFSVSAGIVSARGRSLSGSYDDFIQTDAAINRGNSGGPLFNMNGEVIGVNTAILSPTGGSIGIGFAMSSDVVSKVIDQLEKFGETRRGWLGVRIQDVTDDVAEALGLKSSAGALVTDVPEGPAKAAGMKAGDVIQTFEGAQVEDTRDLVRRVGNAEVGKTVDIGVLREGSEQTLKVVLGRRESAEDTATPAAAEPAMPAESTVLGLDVTELNADLRSQLNLPDGATGLVVKDIAEDSEAYEKGIRAGDLISEAGQKKVSTVADLEARIQDARDAGRKSLLLLVRRDGDPRFVALNLDK